MKNSTNGLVVIFAATAATYLALGYFLPYPGSFLLKAIPIWTLAILAWRSVAGLTGKLLTLGLMLSSAGDIALTVNAEVAFMIGLGFFLLAHITYIVAFAQKTRLQVGRIPFFLLVIGFGTAMAVQLSPHLGGMAAPVFAYLIVIGVMVIFSGLRADVSPLLMVGGLVFMASDAMIAVAKFIAPFPFAKPGIMVTYYIAQFLIVWAFVVSAQPPKIDTIQQ